MAIKLALDRASYARHKQALKGLERAVRKEVLEKALLAGGEIIHSAAETKAPGPLEIVIVGGRTLKKRLGWKGVVKANAKLCAIGPSAEHWYYRFFEFGATAHDISVTESDLIAFDGEVAAYARSTGGIRKRPFLRPAVDGNKEAAVKAIGRVLDAEMKKAAKS